MESTAATSELVQCSNAPSCRYSWGNKLFSCLKKSLSTPLLYRSHTPIRAGHEPSGLDGAMTCRHAPCRTRTLVPPDM